MPTTSPPSLHALQLNTPPNSVDPHHDEDTGSSASSSSPPRTCEDFNSLEGLIVDTTMARLTKNSESILIQSVSPTPSCSSSSSDQVHSTEMSPPNSEKSCDLERCLSAAAEDNSSFTPVPEKLDSRSLSRQQFLSTESSSEDSFQGFYDGHGTVMDAETESWDDCGGDADSSSDCGSDEGKSHFSSLRKGTVQLVQHDGEKSEEDEIYLSASDKTSPLDNNENDVPNDGDNLSTIGEGEGIPSVEAYVEVHTTEDFEKNLMESDVNEGAPGWSEDRGPFPNPMWQETCTARAFYGKDGTDVNLVFEHGRPEEFCRGIPTPDISPGPGSSHFSETQFNMDADEYGDEFQSISSGMPEKELETEIEDMTRFVGTPLIEHVLETQQPMDTVITLADGKLGAHRLVLSAASPFLQELLIEQDARKTATLILPDISKKTMEHLLSLAYTGNVAFTLDEEADLFSAISMLLFGQTFNVSVHRLPPRPKPLPPPAPRQENIKEHSDREEEGNGNSVVADCGSTPRVNQVQRNSAVSTNSSRKSGKNWATFGEVRIVSYCHGCNTQWKTLDRAQKCLLSHGLGRCWVCFEVFTKLALRDHYMTNHCDESSRLDAHNTYIRCRWCPKTVNVKCSIAPFNSHAVTHIQQNQSAKGGKIITEVEDEGEAIPAFEETKTFDGQSLYLRYKTLKGDETLVMEKLTASLRPPPSPPSTKYIPSELTVDNFPQVFIQLNRLPGTIEDVIFRRDSVPPAAPVPSSSSAIPETNTEKIPEEEEREVGESVILDPKSPQPISIVNIQDLMDEEDRVGSPQKKSSEKKRKRSVTPLRLFTKNWGHVNLLAQNLSKQDFKGFPENGSLVVGRDSSNDMWNQIEAMKSKGTEMVVLSMTSADATHYAELFSYLSRKDRVGLVSSEGMSKVMEVILVPLTPENRARMEKIFGASEIEDTVPLESLIAIVVQLNLPVTPEIPKRSTRGRKRRLDSPQPPAIVVKEVPAAAAASFEKPSRRSNRKRPKVIPLFLDGGTRPNESPAGVPGKKIDCVPIQITTVVDDIPVVDLAGEDFDY